MKDEFKEFNITFSLPVLSKQRIFARSLIRGMLMFNDLDLQEDPWDYSIASNRKAPDSSGA